MKKLITVALLITLSIHTNGKEKKTATEQVVSAVGSVVDSTKKAVTETTDMIDTSSNFRRIYTDVKEGIGALSSSLKVGAEHVYIVLVRQQIVIAITDTLWILLWILCMIGFSVNVKKAKWNNDISIQDVLTIIFAILTLIMTMVVSLTGMIPEAIAGYFNPEYGAIQSIIKMVK